MTVTSSELLAYRTPDEAARPRRRIGHDPELMARVAAGDSEAESEVVRQNMPLVLSLARRYHSKGAELGDLLQVGAMGLLRAARKYDPDRGTRFSTLAHWWIRQALSRFVKGPTRVVRIPESTLDRIARLLRMREDLAGLLGREPTLEELAEEAGMKPGKVRRHLEWSREVGSLDGGSDQGASAAVPDHSGLGASPEETARSRELEGLLDAALESLPDRERRVVEDRFGLREPGKVSRAELGRRMGISAERVRQLEHRALGRMRSTMEESATFFFGRGSQPPPRPCH